VLAISHDSYPLRSILNFGFDLVLDTGPSMRIEAPPW